MKFNLLGDYEKFISHIVLHGIDVATKITETDGWKNNRETIAKITVNDVEIPFSLLESYFSDLAERLEKRALEQFSDLDKEVERRLKKRMEEEAQPIIDKFHDILNVLNDPTDLLTPYWDRKNDRD